MKMFLPLLLPLVVIGPAPASGAAPASTSTSAPTPASVNPLTGQPLAFENTQRRLEQMRLETQLLEEEAKQAAIRNNLSLAPIRRTQEERRLQAEMFGPGVPGSVVAATARPQAATPRPPARPARPVRPELPAPSVPGAIGTASVAPPPAATVPQPPQVLAILRNGDQRRAIVQAGGSTLTVSEGDEWLGRRIGPITERTVTIDGNVVELPRNPAVIAAIDRRPPPGQPQAASSVAPTGAPLRPAGPPLQPPLGLQAGSQPFPPLPPLPALPAIGPVDPRNPLSVLGPQHPGVPGGALPRPGAPGAAVAPPTSGVQAFPGSPALPNGSDPLP